jgi:hypothetical protein
LPDEPVPESCLPRTCQYNWISDCDGGVALEYLNCVDFCMPSSGWQYDYQTDPPWIVARLRTCEQSCATDVQCDYALEQGWVIPPDDPLIDCTGSCKACWGFYCDGINPFFISSGHSSIICPDSDPDPTTGVRVVATYWTGDYLCSGLPPAAPDPIADVCINTCSYLWTAICDNGEWTIPGDGLLIEGCVACTPDGDWMDTVDPCVKTQRTCVNDGCQNACTPPPAAPTLPSTPPECCGTPPAYFRMYFGRVCTPEDTGWSYLAENSDVGPESTDWDYTCGTPWSRPGVTASWVYLYPNFPDPPPNEVDATSEGCCTEYCNVTFTATWNCETSSWEAAYSGYTNDAYPIDTGWGYTSGCGATVTFPTLGSCSGEPADPPPYNSLAEPDGCCPSLVPCTDCANVPTRVTVDMGGNGGVCTEAALLGFSAVGDSCGWYYGYEAGIDCGCGGFDVSYDSTTDTWSASQLFAGCSSSCWPGFGSYPKPPIVNVQCVGGVMTGTITQVQCHTVCDIDHPCDDPPYGATEYTVTVTF